MGKFYNQDKSKLVRRGLRKQLTAPEQKLWYRLRGRNLSNIKFRRQYSIGRYVVDFYAPDARVVIEIDGDSHYEQNAIEYDKIRTEYFESCGIRVIRFTNREVMGQLEAVLEKIGELASISAYIPSS
jgi:very-short-patch-repair endonuclease